MKNILITGGCGFIGQNLIAQINRRNSYDRIVVLDNESLGSFNGNIPDNVTFLKGDVRSQDDLRQAMQDCSRVVHLAADTRVMDSIENPAYNFEVNVIGTFNLLTIARELSVEGVINASTGGAIIGEAEPPVHEGMVPRPMAPYGASKLAAEGYGHAFSGAYGLNVMSLRFSNVYGPLSLHKGSVVAHFLRKILKGEPLTVYGDGSQTRDYVFVEDLCDGICRALEAPTAGVFQLGTGRPTSINDLISIIRDTVDDPARIEVHYEDWREGEIRHTHCDISHARRMLGYSPDTELSQGIARTWEWFRTQY